MSKPPVPPELARAYVSVDLPAISGVVRSELEDFCVEEVPIYEPCGEGEHLYLWVEKRGIPTNEAVRRLARWLGVPRRAVGYAGQKDARALTRQWISIHGAAADAAPENLGDSQLTVLQARRHKNKLKVGHLRGNRFTLTIRGAGAGEEAARAVLSRLEQRGVPNYFGLQRFGRDRTTHRLGAALVHEDPEAFAELLLHGARPSQGEAEPSGASPSILEARAALAQGDHAGALAAFPRSCSAELALCRALAKGKPAEQALRAVSFKMRVFYVAAFQSLLFNQYLSRRLERIDQVEEGEVCNLHRNLAAFKVEDPAVEQPRCDALEISPSGPLFGRRLLRPSETSSAWADEEAVLAAEGSGLGAELSTALGSKPLGSRRPLRVPLSEVALRKEGEDLVLSFFLPKGCYATSVLEEMFREQTD